MAGETAENSEPISQRQLQQIRRRLLLLAAAEKLFIHLLIFTFQPEPDGKSEKIAAPQRLSAAATTPLSIAR
jgi:hypothetical protein